MEKKKKTGQDSRKNNQYYSCQGRTFCFEFKILTHKKKSIVPDIEGILFSWIQTWLKDCSSHLFVVFAIPRDFLTMMRSLCKSLGWDDCASSSSEQPIKIINQRPYYEGFHLTIFHYLYYEGFVKKTIFTNQSKKTNWHIKVRVIGGNLVQHIRIFGSNLTYHPN